MQRILIPIDFSENSLNAVKYAIQFSALKDTVLHLAHVVPPIYDPSDVPILNTASTQKKSENAKTILADYIKINLKEYLQTDPEITHQVRAEVMIGEVVRNIADKANELNVSLIIMGTRGDQVGWNEKILGTISSGVLERSNCPVLFIPTDYHFEKLDEVLFASGLLESDAFLIWKALKIIAPYSVVLRCLHISTKFSEEESTKIEEFKNYLSEHSNAIQAAYYQLYDNKVDQNILDYVKNFGSDLLVMTHEEHGFLQRLVVHSHTREVKRHIRIPFLVMKH